MSEILPLRPHHALCIRFFEGKGYSEAFVRHMTAVIGELQSEDPEVTLTGGCDRICEACPKNTGGACETEEKVKAIDDRALSFLGCRVGGSVRWSELYETANETIVRRGRLREVCGGCQWLTICEKKA